MLELTKKYRQDLHRIPELDFDLKKTHDYICEILEPMDCEVTTVAGSGVCAFFDFGKKEAVAFRSDMDALPICEATGADYASEHDGAMHACGHDGHMAMLLVFAHCLQEMSESGKEKKWRKGNVPPTNVLLIFQPAEETTGGAQDICKTGVLKDRNVRRVFGFHLWPYIDKGVISSISGPMMSKSSEINIDIEGKSSHCTAADEGIDALYIGSQYLLQLYAMPEVSAKQPSILKFGKMESGDVRNAISSHTRIEGTLRCLDLETFDTIVGKMEEYARMMEEAYGCKFTVAHSEGYPPVNNDDRLYTRAASILSDLGFKPLDKPSMIAEDFSFYQQEVPGLFMFLGTGTGIPLHSDTFDFDEEILAKGVESYLRLLKI
ncbi:MAG: amidohydrolase [Firmicutes bacterium]|nr:amidohydrolase [Bacillota bacterium]